MIRGESGPCRAQERRMLPRLWKVFTGAAGCLRQRPQDEGQHAPLKDERQPEGWNKVRRRRERWLTDHPRSTASAIGVPSPVPLCFGRFGWKKRHAVRERLEDLTRYRVRSSLLGRIVCPLLEPWPASTSSVAGFKV